MPDANALTFDAARARRIDESLKQELLTSLKHVAANAGLARLSDGIALIAERLRGSAVAPGVIGAYYTLVYALLDNGSGNVDAEQQLLFDEVFAGDRERIVCLEEPATNRFAEMIVRLIDTDPSRRFLLAPPAPGTALEFSRELNHALAFLREVWPEVDEELAVLARMFILASPGVGTDGAFDGASTYMCWGAVILNAAQRKTAIGQLETVIHESSHNLLFGLSMDNPLVEETSERFRSPLRDDPRPLDGIFHATFVSARMTAFLLGLRERARFGAAMRKDLERRIDLDLASTREGLSVLKTAPLTELGKSIASDIESFATG